MEIWPYSLLPDPIRTYSIDRVGSVVRTNMDSGRIRQRKRFTRDIRMFSVEWLFDDFQFEVFQSFFAHTINQGSDFFTVDLWIGDGFSSVSARFENGTYQTSFTDPHWAVSASLEVENAPVLSNDTLTHLIYIGTDLDSFIFQQNRFHIYIHNTSPVLD